MARSSQDYARQSRWSDPGRCASALGELTTQSASLAESIGGLLLHFAVAPARGVAIPPASRSDAAQRTAQSMLAAIVSRDPRPLTAPRAPRDRFFGSCRHFALLAASRLRQAGVPARLRAGFAAYFTPGFLVDHWVCEYDDGRRWRLLDPELDSVARTEFAITFSADDVPRTQFLSAAATWNGIRNGSIDPQTVGVPEIGAVGDWFAAGSLLRDAAALAMQEMQPWDYWGLAREIGRGPISQGQLAQLDSLAQALSQGPATLEAVRQVIANHPWAALTPSVLSFPFGEPIEDAILPAA